MSSLTIAKASSTNLGLVPISEGQMIFVPDTRQVYFDFGGFRQYYCQPIALTESEREEIVSPAGYYFTTDTNALWYYDTKWHRASGSDHSNIVFDTLPKVGCEDTLYIEGKTIKRYKSGQYSIVADVSVWENIL